MKLNPYVIFNGNCEEAMNFYRDILGGEFTMFMRYADAPDSMPVPDEMKNKVMHVTMEFSGATLMGADSMQGPVSSGNNHHLSVSMEDEGEAITIYNALAEGGQQTMPFQEVFWGGKFGMLIDKYKNQWMISAEHTGA